MLFRRGLISAAAVAAAVAVAGCGGSDKESGASAGGSAGSGGDDSVVVGFTSLGFQIPALAEARAGALAKAKELGNVKIEYIPADDVPTQLKAVENLLAKHVDVLAIDPNDSEAISSAVSQANAAGVPVVMWVGKAARGDVATTILSDEHKGGLDIANWAFEKIGGEGSVALLQGDKAHQAGALREEGFREAMGEHPGIKLASYGEAQWARDVGERVANNFLTRSRDLRAIVALNDEMAHGALSAAKARGQAQDLVVTGYNGQCDALESVMRGEMAATLYQPFRDIGAKAVEAAVQAARKESLPEKIDMPAVVVDKAFFDRVASGDATDASEGLVASIEAAKNGCQ
jgi:ribose transport system substrate-binding protein